MSDSMDFPNAWREFLQEYSFKDKEQVYTNGSELIPVFRVEQMVEHYFVEKQTCEYWYQGYYKLLGELANYKWVSVKDKLPEDSGEYLVYIVANNEPKNKSIITLYYTNLSKRFVYYDNDNIFTVTHWRYLPEPPKE